MPLPSEFRVETRRRLAFTRREGLGMLKFAVYPGVGPIDDGHPRGSADAHAVMRICVKEVVADGPRVGAEGGDAHGDGAVGCCVRVQMHLQGGFPCQPLAAGALVVTQGIPQPKRNNHRDYQSSHNLCLCGPLTAHPRQRDGIPIRYPSETDSLDSLFKNKATNPSLSSQPPALSSAKWNYLVKPRWVARTNRMRCSSSGRGGSSFSMRASALGMVSPSRKSVL